MGGLPRRTTVLESLAAESPIVVDGGDSLSPRKTHGDLGAALIKAELMAESWSAAGIDAVALSARDWSLGSVAVREMVARHRLPVLAANLTCGDDQPYPGHTVVERDGVRVGIVGVTGGEVAGCTVSPRGPALQAAVQALGTVDLTVALVPGPRREVDAVSDLDVDVVVMTAPSARLDLGGAVPVTPTTRGKTLLVGRVALRDGATSVWSATQQQVLRDEIDRIRKRVARLDAEAKGAADAARHERRVAHFQKQLDEAEASLASYGTGEGQHHLVIETVELDDKVADHPATAAKVKATLARLDARTPTITPTGPRVVAAGRYLGADGCRDCHRAEYAQWEGTLHAHAYTNLVNDGHGSDPACVECHVTGWNQLGGPRQVSAIGGFRDVQCETCHGAGRAHAGDPEGVDMDLGVSVESCTGCHDGDRDGGRFDHATYRRRILHKQLPTPQ